MVTIEQLTVRYGNHVALDGVDLTIGDREIVCVLGPSGSGKSTLLRAIAGLERPTSGVLRRDGVDLAGVPTHQRRLGLMFQDHALFPHRDVGANVAFGLRMQGRPAAEQRARVGELLTLVGLPGTAERRIQTLSGGEQQRVALARALAPEPRVLLLDEPMGALDRPLRERLVGELGELFAALGLTVLAVTHDQTEAFALAHRLVLLDEGAVLQAGTPQAVWTQPASARAARLLGFANVGHLPGGPPERLVLVRPEGIRFDAAGPLRGTVRSVTFQGARSRVTVVVDGTVLEAEVATAGAPEVGESVTLAVDPGAVVPLAP